MKGRFRKTALAAAAALLVVSGNVPIKPAADLFGGAVVTVSAAEIDHGTCGDNATWSLDDAGKLTISGMGNMGDFTGSTQPWKDHRSYITSVVIEDGVTSIGDSAFMGCASLTSVEIPNSVTTIGDYAFSECTRLTSVKIPNSVTTIRNKAFRDCKGLISISIPDSVTRISADAFRGCTNMIDVYCYADPENLTWKEDGCNDFKPGEATACYVPGKYLDDYNDKFSGSVNVTFKVNPESLPGGKCGKNARWEFDPTTHKLTISGTGDMSDYEYGNNYVVNTPWTAYNYDITSVVIEKGITSVGGSAFFGCTSLTSVKIPDSVTSIGNNAFYGCTSLTSVKIPDSVTSIGNNAFTFCTSLTSVKIPDSVTSIGTMAFSNCTSLTSVEIPAGVTSIGIMAFSNCTSLTSVEIPAGVTSIGSEAFSFCTNLTSVTIPNSVTSIGDYAFSDCTGLTSVKIPDSVTSIGSYLFNGCTGLTSVEIPNSVTSITEGAFQNCKNLTSIKIPDSVTSIGNDAFNGCTNLTSVEIPGSVTSIGYYAFSGCTGLTSVEIPNSVTTIGSSAFNGCTNLKSIEIPGSVTSIGDNTFSGCESLTSVGIPNSVTSIGDGAFYGCTGLTSVKIPDSVKSIGDNAFIKCTGLTSVKVPDSVTSIGSFVFGSCTGLKAIEISNSVTSIGEYAFCYCTDLTSVKIPDSVTSIGKYAFFSCKSLTSIEIPAKVTNIDADAFYMCTGITDVYCDADPKNLTWDEDGNDFKPGKETVCHVPAEHLGYYQTNFSHVNVRFVTDVTVTVADGITNGTVTADKTKVPSDETVTLTVIPETGYAVKSVTINGTKITPVNGVYSFPAPVCDVIVSAEFEKQKCAFNLPEHMEIINGDVLTEGKADYGTEIIFKVSDGYTASNVKNGETELIPDLSGIYTVTVEGDTVITADITEEKPFELKAYGLRLNGDIGLDVYFNIDDSVIKDVTRMVITLPNRQKETVNAPFKKEDNGFYRFSAKVAAKEMTDKVRFELYTNDTVPVYTADVSVRDAALRYLKDDYTTEDELVKAMLNYGAYSQEYFGYRTDDLANKGYEDDISTMTAAELELERYKYDPTTENLPADLSFAKVNLTLESETSLNLYFTDNTGKDVSYTSDFSGTVVVTEENGFTKVAIKNIPAEELHGYATVTITVDGNSSYSVKYSPMTYCYNTLARDNTKELRDCVRAFRLYNKEADAYVKSKMS